MQPPGGAPLVGRACELAELSRPVLGGRGGLTLLSGDAGTGKSRLLTELADRSIAAGGLVLRGHAVPVGGPFRPLAQALVRAAPPALADDARLAPLRAVLARVLPTWPGGPAADRRAVDPVVVLGEALLELLGVLAEHRRCVLLLDDLHWADPDTLAVLDYLAGALDPLPVAVVAAARAEEAQPPGLALLARHPRVPTVRLGPLRPDDVAVLAGHVAGADLDDDLRRAVVGTVDGLPLLVEEVVAGLVERGAARRAGGRLVAVGALSAAVPDALARLVAERVGTLRAGERAVVQAAAVLGADLDWSALPAATGADADVVTAALRAAVEARLLVADPAADGVLRWRHALTRDAVLAGLTAPERAAVAARAAAALDGPALDGDREAVVADLHARGGRPNRAAELLARQARRVADAGALGEARAMLERAAVLAVGDDAVAVRVAIERVRVLALCARADEADEVAAVAAAVAAGPPRTDLAVAAARSCIAAERFADAGRHLAAADPDDARVLALAAHVALGGHDVGRAEHLARRAVAAAVRSGPPESLCEALEVQGRVLRRPDPAGAEAAFRRSAEVAAAHGLVPWRIRALSELAATDVLTGQGPERLERARALAVEAGMPGTVTSLDLQAVIRRLSVDGYLAAAPAARRCAADAARWRLPGPQAFALMFVARAMPFEGRTDAGLALLDRAIAVSPDPVHLRIARTTVLAREAWLAGDDAAAAEGFGTGMAQLRAVAGGANPAPLWGEWALLRTVLDPDDDGPRRALRAADVLVNVVNAGALDYADAVAASAAGADGRAADLLARGDRRLAAFPFFRLLLRTMALPAAGAPGLGDPAALVAEVLAWCAPRGERRIAERARGHLRRLGLPVPRPGRDAVAVPPGLRALGVTGRELEVLRLVAEGLGNGEIADRLHVSKRTVETHVGRLLAKTGAPRRAALRAVLGP